MTPPYDAPPPHRKYGSVDDYEQPTSHGSIFPRSTTEVGGHQNPSQNNKTNLRSPEAGGIVTRRLVFAVVCGLTFLAGSGVSWSRSSGSRNTAAGAGGFFEVTFSTGIPAAQSQPGEPSSYVGDDADDVVALQFTALNFYHVRDGKPGQDYPWLKDVKIIEPYRETTLAVVGAREGFDYRWEVRAGSSSTGLGRVGEVQATATGAVTMVVFTQLDENVVVIEEVDDDGRVTKRLAETVMVKYVRREIRTLTEDEREELLDAVSVEAA